MRKHNPGKFLLLLMLAAANASAWWSVAVPLTSTHHKISEDARSLPGSAFPDVTVRFGGNVSDWTSGSTDDARAHGGNATLNGGPIRTWWTLAKEEYAKRNFNNGDWSAYYYVALMMHLTEDQAVPAHASEILHGSAGWMDNMEELAYYNYQHGATAVVPAASPTDNYFAMKLYTLDAIADDFWRQYWIPGISGEEHTGSYGGPANTDGRRTDVFPTSWGNAGERERGLMQQVLGAAVGYTAGALIETSKGLGCVASDLTIAPGAAPVINTQDGNDITFYVRENRDRNVRLFITVDSANGPPIISSVYGHKYDASGNEIGGVPAVLDPVSTASDLPWGKTITIPAWKGNVYNSELGDGPHTLHVQIMDADGNYSDVIQVDFIRNFLFLPVV